MNIEDKVKLIKKESFKGSYNLEEIQEIVNKALYYVLEGKEVLNDFLLVEIMEIYNGAGPDSWPESLRWILTKAMGLFKPVIMIHDLDFQNSDGTKKTFLEVAERWVKNTRKVFDKEYPLYTWKMLRPSYRYARDYWWSVMQLANEAIASDSAFEAWQKSAKGKALS